MRKKCSKCGQRRPVEKFYRDKRSKDGYESQCKLCRSIAQKSRRSGSKSRFSRYKSRAKRDGIIFKLSYEEFKKITDQSCFYCGTYSENSVKDFCGIDRVNSSKGYIKGNIVPCCNVCNMMKGIMYQQEFLDKVEEIYYNLIHDTGYDGIYQ